MHGVQKQGEKSDQHGEIRTGNRIGPNALMTFRTNVELISNQNVLIPDGGSGIVYIMGTYTGDRARTRCRGGLLGVCTH